MNTTPAEPTTLATAPAEPDHAIDCDGLTFLGRDCDGSCLPAAPARGLIPVVREVPGGGGRLWYAVAIDAAGSEVEVIGMNLDRTEARSEARAWRRAHPAA